MVLEVEQDPVEVLKVAEIHLEQDSEIVAVEAVAVSEIVVETVVVDVEIDVQKVDELIDEKVDEVVDEEHEEVDVGIDVVVDVADETLGEVFDARDIRMVQVPVERSFHLAK